MIGPYGTNIFFICFGLHELLYDHHIELKFFPFTLQLQSIPFGDSILFSRKRVVQNVLLVKLLLCTFECGILTEDTENLDHNIFAIGSFQLTWRVSRCRRYDFEERKFKNYEEYSTNILLSCNRRFNHPWFGLQTILLDLLFGNYLVPVWVDGQKVLRFLHPSFRTNWRQSWVPKVLYFLTNLLIFPKDCSDKFPTVVKTFFMRFSPFFWVNHVTLIWLCSRWPYQRGDGSFSPEVPRW